MRRPRFRNRRDAGRVLAQRLRALSPDSPVIVALPRGGVPVGFEVARALDAPLDISLVRKVGAPENPEFGVGAIAEDGEVVLDVASVQRLGIRRDELEDVIEDEIDELERRRRRYRSGHPEVGVRGRTVIIVDDGLATGLTAVAVARTLRSRGAERIVLAVPVCPAEVSREIAGEFDEVICLISPQPFMGVGAGYLDFTPTSDREVTELLAESRAARESSAADLYSGELRINVRELDVEIPTADGPHLPGLLAVPEEASGLVVLVHGSGSSRLSPRNAAVAKRLNSQGFATLLFDLLTESEAADRRNVFDIALLARRLIDATTWARGVDEIEELPIGYFGASTGAAAALVAARLGAEVDAIVSRGGRPDLAGRILAQVSTPTLLIVGALDREVLALNHEADAHLPRSSVAVVPGAGHLFEEPGALARVARLAGEWFTSFLAGSSRRTEPRPSEEALR